MRSYLLPATGCARTYPLAFAIITTVALATVPRPAAANNLNESLAWQFQSANDLAAQAALRDLIEQRRGGAYAAPTYTTNIARQYNCSIAATATGNSGAQTALANSPTTTGATASATGNNNASSVEGDGSTVQVGNAQVNTGTVGSAVIGSTSSTVIGTAWQALNSEQSNSGNQSASVQNASACTFGVLN